MCCTLCPAIFLLFVLQSGRRLPITCQPLGPPTDRVVPVQNTRVALLNPTHSCRRRFRCSLSPSIVPSFPESRCPQTLTLLTPGNAVIQMLPPFEKQIMCAFRGNPFSLGQYHPHLSCLSLVWAS